MKKCTWILTDTYYMEDGYYIDIVTKMDEGTFEAYLYNELYGIKELMFSVPADEGTYEDFIDMVWANYDTENYKDSYTECYMEG